MCIEDASIDNRIFSDVHPCLQVSDGGRPPLSSTGLVEVRVGRQPSVQLNFQQRRYTGTVAETGQPGARGQDVVQVQAVRWGRNNVMNTRYPDREGAYTCSFTGDTRSSSIVKHL